MEEINFIRPQEVFNRNTGESKVRYTSYDGSNKFIPVVDGEDGVPRTLVITTHAELKAMRDAGKLTPGALYRITDYQCTTTQENTRSAGHQFDIVLLALSEDKLAEEGWAMEHPTDVYDVTFQGDYHNPIIVRKCYIYCIDIENNLYNIVDCETLLGISGTNGDGEDFIIDEINKTCDATLYGVDDLNVENLTYNYFQNSNLSAWKVWYCLDNDTARFAWADDSVDEGSPASIIESVGNLSYIRNPARDEQNYFAWDHEGTNIYTETSTPSIGDTIYLYNHGMIDPSPETVASYTPPTQGTGLPNGRGVIYRLIDEWNIDYPCDFKNMQILVPMDSDDNIDMQNPNPFKFKYCYAFTDNTSGEPEDLSINGHAINIKVKPKLIEETHYAVYFSPETLFYTNHNEEHSCKFSNVTVGIAGTTIFINRGDAINILDGNSNVILKDCEAICIGYNSNNIMLDTVVGSTFGSNCQNIQLVNEQGLNYGNNGVELATKDDLN